MSPSSPSATSEQHYLQENFKTLLQLCPKTVSIPRLQSYDDEYMKKERVCITDDKFKILLSASNQGAETNCNASRNC